MKSNYLVWLLAAGVLLLGIWYWTNAQAPATAPAGTEETMMEEGEEDAMMEEDSEAMMEEGEEDAMMEEEGTGGAEDDSTMVKEETTIKY